jgi:hypothetical protein
MTRTIIRTLCDGEELVLTGIQDLPSQVEGDPREVVFLRRNAALSGDSSSAERVASVAPARAPLQEAQ